MCICIDCLVSLFLRILYCRYIKCVHTFLKSSKCIPALSGIITCYFKRFCLIYCQCIYLHFGYDDLRILCCVCLHFYIDGIAYLNLRHTAYVSLRRIIYQDFSSCTASCNIFILRIKVLHIACSCSIKLVLAVLSYCELKCLCCVFCYCLLLA